jgi:tRNA(Ile)-lysidine synthase
LNADLTAELFWCGTISSVHALAERLLSTIRKHSSIRAGDRVAVAVSGGADSVALLFLMLELRSELGIVLSVAHVNHKLRNQESDEDANFVAQLAKQHELELHLEDAPVPRKTKPKSEIGSEVISGIEAAARDLRYAFFRGLAQTGRVTNIATAHTLDDQAETLLLRIFRGTGIRGLAGIHPQVIFEEDGRAFGELVRPLLGFRRAALVEYLRDQKQDWREDSSNRDIAFLRNRVRHRLLPMITEEFGEASIEHMSELAEIARAEEEHWKCLHPEVWPQKIWPQSAVNYDETSRASPLPRLAVEPLLMLPLASQRRVVRQWLEVNTPGVSISFRVIAEVLGLTRVSTDKVLQLSGDWNLRRAPHELLLESIAGRQAQRWAPRQSADYEYPLPLPGAVEVPELAVRVEARVVDAASVPEKDCGILLDIERAPKQVLIRNWRSGDRFWPSHTAAAKKVKQLLNDRHVTGAEKKLWPVAEAEGCGIIWMRGFAAPAAFRAPAGSAKAIWIRETAIAI